MVLVLVVVMLLVSAVVQLLKLLLLVVFGVRVVRGLLPPCPAALRYRFVKSVLFVIFVVVIVGVSAVVVRGVTSLQTSVFRHAIVSDLDDRPGLRVMVMVVMVLGGVPLFRGNEHHGIQFELSERQPGDHHLVELVLRRGRRL